MATGDWTAPSAEEFSLARLEPCGPSEALVTDVRVRVEVRAEGAFDVLEGIRLGYRTGDERGRFALRVTFFDRDAPQQRIDVDLRDLPGAPWSGAESSWIVDVDLVGTATELRASRDPRELAGLRPDRLQWTVSRLEPHGEGVPQSVATAAGGGTATSARATVSGGAVAAMPALSTLPFSAESFDVDLYGSTTEFLSSAGPIGTSFCPGTRNSTGTSGKLTAKGSTSVADGDLRLMATDLPPDFAGLFLYGRPAVGLAIGQGILCIARDSSTGFLGSVTTTPSGTAVLRVDPASAPWLEIVRAAPVEIGFQFWHRDVVFDCEWVQTSVDPPKFEWSCVERIGSNLTTATRVNFVK